MRKQVLALTLVLAFVLGISAQAAPLRAPRLYPNITFSGTTATCTASVRGGQCHRRHIHDGQAVAGGNLPQDLDSQRNRVSILEQDCDRDQWQDLQADGKCQGQRSGIPTAVHFEDVSVECQK